jgi:Avidin family
MLRIILAFVVVVSASVSAFAQSLPLPSYWTNELTSDMKLFPTNPPSPGKFSGLYWNNAAGFKCRASPTNPPYAVTGRNAGPDVTLTVVWNNGVQNCKTTTIWHGTVSGGTLTTHWVLFGSGVPRPIYGEDIFQQQP